MTDQQKVGDDWKIGFQSALANYFYAQRFFVYDGSYYHDGSDYEATEQMRAHFQDDHCEVDREWSDGTVDFEEKNDSFFTDTDSDSMQKTFVVAHMTCRCRRYQRLPVAINDSLSNAIKWVTQ